MWLFLLSGEYTVCRLDAGAAVPGWAWGEGFAAVVRTGNEVSVVCRAETVPKERPDGMRTEGPWRVLEVQGPLDFALTGVLAGLAGPLAAAGVPIFAVSTFGTDYLLVKAGDLGRATAALRGAGHQMVADD